MEGAPKDAEKIESDVGLKTDYVENVVAHTIEAGNVCMENPHSPICDTEKIHEKILNTELCDSFKQYEDHEILHLSDIDEGLTIISSNLENEIPQLDKDSEDFVVLEKNLKLLRERGKEIRISVRRYIRTLSEFVQIKKRQNRLEPEDFRDKFEGIDGRRRTAHNTLIESLNVYSDVVADLKDYGFLEDLIITEWSHGLSMPEPEEQQKQVLVFSKQMLQNRDLVKDWAISAYLYEQLLRIDKIKENDSKQ